MPKSVEAQELSPFEKLVEEALNQFQDPVELGRTSPLAAPYMLATYLGDQDASAEARGKALRTLIRNTMQAFDGKHAERHRSIIQARYIEDRSEEEILQQIHLQKGAYHRSRRQAIRQLSEALNTYLNPALQLEAPPRVYQDLLGRENEIHVCRQTLAAGRTVTLTGAGGVGKTSLGSYLAREWNKDALFWYTFRSGVNDHSNNLARAMGLFFRRLQQPLLWQEVVVGGDRLDLQRLIELVRNMLRALRSQGVIPLFCFDEVDILHPDQQVAHSALIALLENLSHEAPMILMGQQIVVTPQSFCLLTDLTLAQMSHLLENAGIGLTLVERHKVFAYTHGNPRLLELFIALAAYGEPLPQLLQAMTSAPPTEFFLRKLLRRLEPLELALLRAISVFRNPAPADVWQQGALAHPLYRLLERKLLHSPGPGRVAILPAYADFIYRWLAVEERQQLHLAAAAIREDRGEHTAAAHHWIQGGQPEKALVRWRQYQDQAISQGQAAIALHLFSSLDVAPFMPEARQLHALICGELARLTGDLQGSLDHLHAATWSTAILTTEAYLAQGIIANDQSRFVEAKALFVRALQRSEAIIEVRQSLAYKSMSWSHFQDLELEAAWRAAQLARYEAENIQGLIQQERGSLAEADALYQSALQLAEEVGYVEGMAKTLNNLITLSAILGHYERAKHYFAQGDECYTHIGKLSGRYLVHINLAFAANLAGDHAQALSALAQIPTMSATAYSSLTPRILAQIQ